MVIYQYPITRIVSANDSFYWHHKARSYYLDAFHPTVYDEIELKITKKILSFVTKGDGKILLNLSLADLLGKSCLSIGQCDDNQYCLINDTFVVEGLCLPCSNIDEKYTPETCKKD